MNDEIWADVPEFEGRYKVSNLGRVKSFGKRGKGGRIKREIILKPSTAGQGYFIVFLYRGGRFPETTPYIHRLVARAFVPNPENKPNVNHLDGVRTNNQATNLEWCTQSGNLIHSWATGLSKHSGKRLLRKRNSKGQFA